MHISIQRTITTCSVSSSKERGTISYVCKDIVTKWEVLWAFSTRLFASHFSYNSSRDLGEIFKVMFPDSNITQRIAIGSTKLSYLITNGSAPYFHQVQNYCSQNLSFVWMKHLLKYLKKDVYRSYYEIFH